MWKWSESLMGGEGGGGGDEEENLLVDESGELGSLSQLQRIYAFGASMAGGLLFMLLSLIVFSRPIKFAVMFTLGNLFAVGSTVFLIGPQQQARMMFNSARVYASSMYLGSVILALICALLIHSKILTLLAIILEIGALIWYSLSYIPFARRIVSNLCITLCDTEM